MGLTPDTPYLRVDLDILDRNLRAVAADTSERGLDLRPHVKTHKMLELARLQRDAGARGLTVATVSEAEIFADAGFDDLFIAYPVWPSGSRARRLRELAERVALRIGVDSAESAAELGKALPTDAVEVLVEVDSGHHCSGVRPAEAGSIAIAAARAGLRVAGVFNFPGHSYAPEGAASSARDEASAIVEAAASLESAGIEARVRSGGSSPSRTASDASVLTEIRPGVYVFNDAQQVELGVCGFDEVSLVAVATVVSRSGNSVIVDAGSKVLGADRAAWATGYGRLATVPEARIVAISEHHATLQLPESVTLPALGSVLSIVPNHVCNTVNLADEVIVSRGGELLDRWSVAARGANT